MSDESESSESSLEDGSDSYFCLRRLFRIIFLVTFFLLRLESDDDDESFDKSDGGGSGSDFTFDLRSLHFDVEIGSDRVFSIRVGISSIVSRSSIFVFCSTIRVVVSRIKSSLSSIFTAQYFPAQFYLALYFLALTF